MFPTQPRRVCWSLPPLVLVWAFNLLCWFCKPRCPSRIWLLLQVLSPWQEVWGEVLVCQLSFSQGCLEIGMAEQFWTYFLGLAVFTAVLNTNLRTRFAKIPGYGTEFTVPRSASDYIALQNLPDGTTKDQVMTAFANSFRQCWIIGCAFFLGCLVVGVAAIIYLSKRPTDRCAFFS